MGRGPQNEERSKPVASERPVKNQQRPPRRLYLVTPELGDPASFLRDIGAALDAGDVAAILLRLEKSDERTLINRAKTVAAGIQRRDVALLLDGHPEVAVRAGADGAHLTGIEALAGALPTLRPDRIAGVGGLRSRHDAMLAGEAGADYVMFGDPDRAAGRPSFDAIEERLEWWSELFEAPCVGYAASLDEVAPLAQSGADFVALGDWMWTRVDPPAAVVAEAAGRLTEPASRSVP